MLKAKNQIQILNLHPKKPTFKKSSKVATFFGDAIKLEKYHN